MAKGARIVLNSKYFRVAQPGEKPNGKTILSKAAVTNLIEYIATREGVSLNYTFSEEVAPRAATHKQKETIEGLLELIPEGKDTLEYNDYIENPTIKNASELISRVGEMGMEDTLDVDSASNLIEYVAMRPGAVRVGEHGLFSSENSLNLEEAKKEVSEHKGRIWSHVISLRREDADVLGYNTQCPWRNLVISQLDTIAHAHHISVNNLRWYAGMHDTSHHPHIHLEVFSNDETEGYLSSKGIEKMKSAFAHEIFEVELGQVEQEKTKHRDQLKLKFNELFNQIENNPLLQYDEKILQRLAEKLLDLSKELPDKGRKYYKFMPKNIKEKVDNLLEETINNSPALKEMYNTWCEKQVEIEKIYKNEPEQAISILSRPEFKSLKNSILRSAYALRYAENGQRSVESQGDTIRIATSEKDIQSIMDWSLLELQEEAEHHNLNACYQLAKKYQTGDGIKMDLYKAAMWYSIAADNGHSMAAYKLGQIYLSNTNDNIITKNEELGQEYCHKAYLRFYHELQDPRVFEKIENNKLVALDEGIESPYGAYLQCVIGDMYLKGEGVEKDYKKAFSWFELSAANGYINAYYKLGNLYYHGQGTKQDLQQAMNCYRKAKGNPYAEYKLGIMYQRGEGTQQNFERAAAHFVEASSQNNPYAHYKLANLIEDEKLQSVEKDPEVTNILYEKSLDLFKKLNQKNASDVLEYRIGQMYLSGKGTEINLPEAEKWLGLSAAEGNPFAAYKVATLLENGTIQERSAEDLYSLYQTALRGFQNIYDESQDKGQPNSTLSYRIGQMYLSGKGTEINLPEAEKWLGLSAAEGNPFAIYQIATLSENGTFQERSVEDLYSLYQTALQGFQNIYDSQPNSVLSYRIGQMYLSGKGTEINLLEAERWLELSAVEGNSFAAYKVATLSEDGTFQKRSAEDLYSLYQTALQGFQNIYDESQSHDEDQLNSILSYRIGQMYLSGKGTEINLPEAEKWLGLSAAEGNFFAAYKVATLSEDGTFQERSAEDLYSLYQTALQGFQNIYDESQDKGQPNSTLSYRIGQMYLSGKGTEINLPEAEKWLGLSAAEGNPFAIYQIATLSENGTFQERSVEDLYSLYQTALQGFQNIYDSQPNSVLSYRIGQMYLSGKGTEINLPEAERWLELSAVGGNSFAAYKVATLSEDGTFQKRSAEDLYSLYQTALQGFQNIYDESQNHDEDQLNSILSYRIGQMYLSGKGTEINLPEAEKWLGLSAAEGNPFAIYQIATLSENGTFQERSVEDLYSLYQTALQGFQNIYDSQPNSVLSYRIGQMYLSGKGTEINLPEAEKWLGLSAAEGNPFAAYKVATLSENGTFQERSAENLYSLYQTALQGFQNIYGESQNEGQPDSTLSYRIGQMYLSGKGTEINLPEAERWLGLSAAEENPYAQYSLAMLYKTHYFLSNDNPTVYFLFQKSLQNFQASFSESPNGSFAFKIAGFYQYGYGTPVDITLAVNWYKIALDLGNLEAEEALKNIKVAKMEGLFFALSGFAYHTARIFREQMRQTEKQSTDRKIKSAIKKKRIQQGHNPNEQYYE